MSGNREEVSVKEDVVMSQKGKMTPKGNKEIDCRAISSVFFEEFGENKRLEPFVKLVKEHKELELLFRGNSSDKGSAVIYRNNGAMFTITYPDKIEFDLNYLRYDIEWAKHLESLKRLYNNTDSFSPEIKEKKDNKTGKIKKSCEITQKLCADLTEDFCNNLDEIYSLMSLIFYRYFDYSGDCLRDHFREYVNSNLPAEKKLRASTKKRKTEKIRQQQLYTQLKKSKNGYFIYDLEFAQKNDQSDSKNKPDMQAIRFDKKGMPVAWVLVEVKSTESACNGAAGLNKHIACMQGYLTKEKLIEKRCEEAYKLLSQYRELGLISLETELHPSDFEKLDTEIILIFTDEAIDVWNDYKQGFSGYKEKAGALDDKSKYVLVSGVENFKFQESERE